MQPKLLSQNKNLNANPLRRMPFGLSHQTWQGTDQLSLFLDN